MKAGIMTFHRALNYGAVLQTYALCSFVNEFDVECEVVNYYSEPLESTYKIFDFKKNNFVSAILKGLFKGAIIIKKRNGFNKFIENNVKISSKKYSFSQLKQLNNLYDLFITGSDQVWSPSCVGFDEAYFLTFADDGKKNSYAASIGCSVIPENKKAEYKHRLEHYRNISVREEKAIDLLKQVGIKLDMNQNIDPTLLIDSNQYSKIAKKPKEQKYVLLFSVNMPVNLIAYAKNLAEKKGLKVIYLNDKPIMRVKGIEYKSGVSPEEFIGYIKYADYVVTNSFHGTVFSVIFHKNFFVEFNTKNGRNVRAEELLKRLSIDNKEILGEKAMADKSVDWNLVDQLINQERNKSKEYIEKVLKSYDE